MTDHRLDGRREDTSPKCATCSWWLAKGTEATAGECGQHGVKTLDLALCSGWRAQSRVEHDIIEPEAA
jgi:hypothetical protein